MSYRMTFAGAVVAAVALLALAAAPAAAQTEPPRTAWGAPDLGGVWDYRSITRMERPEEFGDQEFLTAEEVANLEQRALDRLNNFLDLPAQRTEAGDQRRQAAGRRERLLQPYLARSGPGGGRHGPDLADRRPAERPLPAVDARWAAPRRRVPRAPAQPAGRFVAGLQHLRPLHPGLQRRAADDAERLQQQHAVVPDAGPRRDRHRDGEHRAHRAAGRASCPAVRHAAVVGRVAWTLGGRHAGHRDRELRCAPAVALHHRQHAPDRAVDPASTRTRCSTRPPSTTRRPGNARGPSRCR